MDEQEISQLTRQAISAALANNWAEAIELNKQILKLAPENIESLNRLARAYFETGKYSLSKKTYQSALKQDPYNVIAQKNLKRLASFKASDDEADDAVPSETNGNNRHIALSPSLFLEEAGITKVITLVRPAEPVKLSRLSPGTLVKLNAKNRSVSVTDLDDNYLGALPDDLAHLLIKLIKGGNKYQALIKSIKQNNLTILIRETHRSLRFRNQPSFIADSRIQAYPSDSISLSNEEDLISESMESDDSYSG